MLGLSSSEPANTSEVLKAPSPSKLLNHLVKMPIPGVCEQNPCSHGYLFLQASRMTTVRGVRGSVAPGAWCAGGSPAPGPGVFSYSTWKTEWDCARASVH